MGVVNLSTLTGGNYEAQDGDVLTGTLSGNMRITVAPDAVITIRDVNITSLANDRDTDYAGITLLGNGTILLEGTNTVKGGLKFNPGIYVPENKTLTIDGTGSLYASSNGDACGIGGGYSAASGNIVINDGTITAIGGEYSAGIGGVNGACGSITINGGNVTASTVADGAGIGSGSQSSCGDITISGGIVNATGGEKGAGIGTGFLGTCGDITISGGNVTAIGGADGAGIGTGYLGTCGDITISGGIVNATGGESGAGIGTGYLGTCGNITIAANVIQVTATKGNEDAASIGEGFASKGCGSINIAPGANVIQN